MACTAPVGSACGRWSWMSTGGESSKDIGPESPDTPTSEAWAVRLAQQSSNGWGVKRGETGAVDSTGREAVYQPLTSSPGGSPAKTYPSPVAEQGSLALEVGSGGSFTGSLESYSQLGFSWKTSLGCCLATGDETSEACSHRWETSGISWNGECWTRATSEFPNGGGVCSLSDILEDRPHARFSLSQKAAAGILKRAARRERTLPPHLEAALQEVAGTPPTSSEGEDS